MLKISFCTREVALGCWTITLGTAAEAENRLASHEKLSSLDEP